MLHDSGVRLHAVLLEEAYLCGGPSVDIPTRCPQLRRSHSSIPTWKNPNDSSQGPRASGEIRLCHEHEITHLEIPRFLTPLAATR